MGPTTIRTLTLVRGMPQRRWPDSSSLVATCLDLMLSRPASEVAAVLRSGYLELTLAAAVAGMPMGAARADAAVAALTSARIVIERDRAAERLGWAS